jgi:hypothetical protein
MNMTWQLSCRPETFEQCKTREGFSEVVSLARCVNTLTSFYSALSRVTGEEARDVRDRMHFYFFTASILYEGLLLVQKMNKPFKNDTAFQKILRPILKDSIAQKIEQDHLKNVRHGAVFHFLPEYFRDVLRDQPSGTCVFLKSNGTFNRDIHYEFADYLALKILAGEKVIRLATLLAEIEGLNGRFAEAATEFIKAKLKEWGFDRESTGEVA